MENNIGGRKQKRNASILKENANILLPSHVTLAYSFFCWLRNRKGINNIILKILCYLVWGVIMQLTDIFAFFSSGRPLHLQRKENYLERMLLVRTSQGAWHSFYLVDGTNHISLSSLQVAFKQIRFK